VFEDMMASTLLQLAFQRRSSSEPTVDEILSHAFKVMWDKQRRGLLACSHICTSLDLFFTWLKYVYAANGAWTYELDQINSDDKIENVVEQILRENLNSILVTDAKTQDIIGLISAYDLIKFFCT